MTNPMFDQVKGKISLGEELCITTKRSIEYHAVITELDHGKRLVWRIQNRGYSSEHIFELTQCSGGTNFSQIEYFHGWLAFIAWPLLGYLTQSVFSKLNIYLKENSERLNNTI